MEALPPRTESAGLPAWFSTIPIPPPPRVTPQPQPPVQPAPKQSGAGPPPAPSIPEAPEPKSADVTTPPTSVAAEPPAAKQPEASSPATPADPPAEVAVVRQPDVAAAPVETPATPSPPTAPSEAQPTPTPPTAEGDTVSVSERFTGVGAASEFAPPVAWYAPVAAVPVDQNLAVQSELAVKVAPPAAAAADPAKPLTVALSETAVAAISPPRIPRPALAPASETDRQPFASDMVEPPPGTPPAVTAIDPNRLRALMQQGSEAYSAGEDVQQAKGLRLIRIAAALGLEPARSLVAREFPRSRVLRIVIPAAEAVRYSLDEFIDDPISAGAADGAFVSLAVYFAERQAMSLFAGHFLDAIQDDRRLQEESRLQAILTALARVSGSCAEIARLVALPSARSGPGCPPTLQFYVESHLRAKGSQGRDASSRRQAMSQLQALAAAR
jgi:hypothetical protein